MLFSQNEKQLLAIIYGLTANQITADNSMINKGGREFFKNGLLNLENAYQELIDKRVITLSDNGYLLIHQGEELGAEFLAEFMQSGFNSGLNRFNQSNTFKKFCKELYGRDLGQLSLINERQLCTLISALQEQKPQIVLDLGCGLGRITEHLAIETGTSFIGVDYAEDAVLAAEKRCNLPNLKFICQNMNQLNLPDAGFDAIIAIDSLYFADDLEALVANLKLLLKPSGKMYLFYSGAIDAEKLHSDEYQHHTKLAQILRNQQIEYSTTDFSIDEFVYWHNVIEVGEPLKAEFEAEGNLELIEQLISEANVNLEPNALLRVRYLYETGCSLAGNAK